jgi:hypothetical protein
MHSKTPCVTRCRLTSQYILPAEYNTHKGGFALGQRFPQPLLDCDSSVKRKELLPKVISPGPESQSKRQSIKLVLRDCVLFLLPLLLLSKHTATTIPYLYLGPWQSMRNPRTVETRRSLHLERWRHQRLMTARDANSHCVNSESTAWRALWPYLALIIAIVLLLLQRGTTSSNYHYLQRHSIVIHQQPLRFV